MTKEKQYTCDITFKVFKQTYKEAFSGDHWGTALDAWFECAGRMWMRGLHVPNEWDYSPGMGSDPTEEDSYFHALMDEASDEVLLEIGTFLTRYCQYLKYKKADY